MEGFDLESFWRTANKVRERAIEEKRIYDNPSDEQLKELLAKEPGAVKTRYGNFVAESEPTSRSAMFTKNSVDSQFGADEAKLLSQCETALAKEKLICVDRIVGNEKSKTIVRFMCPERFAHAALGGRNLFAPVKGQVKEPTYQIIFFAMKPSLKIRIDHYQKRYHD